MSCKDCKKAGEDSTYYYYLWDTANIRLVGCEKHVKEVMHTLDFAKKYSIKQMTMLADFCKSFENTSNE